MKVVFLTNEDRAKLPVLYSQDGVPLDDHIVYVKYFHPYGAGTWLAMEFDGNDQFFGAVDLGHGYELGYFSLSELSALKARIGGREMPFQAIERDRHFRPTKYGELKAA